MKRVVVKFFGDGGMWFRFNFSPALLKSEEGHPLLERLFDNLNDLLAANGVGHCFIKFENGVRVKLYSSDWGDMAMSAATKAIVDDAIIDFVDSVNDLGASQ